MLVGYLDLAVSAALKYSGIERVPSTGLVYIALTAS
jgi:hypothetical protein